MKIAQVSPLYESVPPKLYGGTERVVHYITEELVAQGHDVTLFASGDSVTSAKLIPASNKSLRLDKNCIDQLAPHITMMEMIENQAHQFDIIHNHIDYMMYPLIKRSKQHFLTTLHGRLDIPELQPLYREFFKVPVVSISDSQRLPIPFANWKGTIYHGLPLDLYQLNPGNGSYLVFIGRISPEKRVDRAIEIAIKADLPLKIAAKIDNADKDYFAEKIKHLIDHPLIELVGEVNDDDKQELYGNALGLIYPIDWPEPFGLAMIEAMACGTPVVAYGHGSVPEVVDEGVTGFIVNSQEEAVEAVKKLQTLSRKKCREVFEHRFSATRMANDYLAIYESLRLSGENNFTELVQNPKVYESYGKNAKQ
jgi:glycosyltransferase involved in cell wall biosynthesis